MTQTKYPNIENMMKQVYEQNSIHFDFVEDMQGGDCDCSLHNAMNVLIEYIEEK